MGAKTDFLIVGQGIAGILIAFELIKKGYTCRLIDDEKANAASLSAGALLNPVNLNTGKIFPEQQQDFELALQTYLELETFLSTNFVDKFPLILFPEADQFLKFQNNPLLKPAIKAEIAILSEHFHFSETPLKLRETQRIRFQNLKAAWIDYWQHQGLCHREVFNYSDCKIRNGIAAYNGFEAKSIIFAEGANGNRNPYFPNLPFTANLGNVLHLSIPSLPQHFGYHFNGKKLLPFGHHEFWFGSNYQWRFTEPKARPGMAKRKHLPVEISIEDSL